MIANSAFLAAMVLVLLVFFLMAQLTFLAPYKRLIVQQYLWVIVWSLVTVFVNLFAFFYAVNRRLFLKDTGRKFATVHDDGERSAEKNNGKRRCASIVSRLEGRCSIQLSYGRMIIAMSSISYGSRPVALLTD
jgi:hypothetical protein